MSKKHLDEFFEKLEENPSYGMQRGDNRIEVDGYLRERKRRVREITVLKAQVETILEQISGIMREMMEDPLYSELSEKLLYDLHATLGILQDAIDRNEEDIRFIEYCVSDPACGEMHVEMEDGTTIYRF